MTTAVIPPSASSSISKRVLWVLALGAGAWFVVNIVPGYFVFTEESYGPYFWPRASYLFPHIVGGLIAILIGPLQFWSKFRASYPSIHRASGRVYLLAILLGSVGSFGMVVTMPEGRLSYATGLSFMAVAWLATSAMALVSVKKRNFVQHKQWMIRSYVVTFSFVSFRLFDDILGSYDFDRNDYLVMLAWATWAVPLLFTELAIQAQQVFRTRPA